MDRHLKLMSFTRCFICAEFIQNAMGKRGYRTACGHAFHLRCLYNWLKRARTCPQCNKATVFAGSGISLAPSKDHDVAMQEELQNLRRDRKESIMQQRFLEETFDNAQGPMNYNNQEMGQSNKSKTICDDIETFLKKTDNLKNNIRAKFKSIEGVADDIDDPNELSTEQYIQRIQNQFGNQMK